MMLRKHASHFRMLCRYRQMDEPSALNSITNETSERKLPLGALHSNLPHGSCTHIDCIRGVFKKSEPVTKRFRVGFQP